MRHRRCHVGVMPGASVVVCVAETRAAVFAALRREFAASRILASRSPLAEGVLRASEFSAHPREVVERAAGHVVEAGDLLRGIDHHDACALARVAAVLDLAGVEALASTAARAACSPSSSPSSSS